MTSPDSKVLCSKYELGFPVTVNYMCKMTDSFWSVFIYFILYNSDQSPVRWREQLLLSPFLDKESIPQGGELTYSTSNK